MVPYIRHKLGDTLKLTCLYQDDEGNSIDLTGLTIRADLVGEKLRHRLSVQIVNAAKGSFTLSASATETAKWTLGHMQCDIQYRTGSTVSSSETFSLHLIEQVTDAN